jgi:hypothetical protein
MNPTSIVQQLSSTPRFVYLLNLWTSLLVLFIVLVLLTYQSTYSQVGPEQRFRTRALALWGGWWFSLTLCYLMFCEAELKWHGVELAVIDAGSISMLCFATAYTRGVTFQWRHTMTIVFGGVILILWDVLTGQFYRTPVQRVIAIAPSAVLTTSWVISVGWAFYVRWGATAFPFLALTIAYVVLQAPAYFYTFVVQPFEPQFPDLMAQFKDLQYIYWWLFVGKIGYAGMFFLLFLSPHPFAPDMAVEQQAPPHTPVELYPRSRMLMSTMFVAFSSVFSAAAASVFSQTIGAWLHLLGFPTPGSH